MIDELLADHPEPRDAVEAGELRRKTHLSHPDMDWLAAEGYLDPVYVPEKGFMVAGDQAKNVIALVNIARKAGGRFPPAHPSLPDVARARFVASGGASRIAAQLLRHYRYSSLKRVWPRIVRQAVPAARLRAARPGSTRSRIGGLPDLPLGMQRPRRGDSPLSFVAQMDLSGLARGWRLFPLPPSGVLSFFYDMVKRPWGFEPSDRDGWAVYHFEQETLTTLPPDDLPDTGRFQGLAVRPVGELKLPPLESKAVEELGLKLKEQTAYEVLLDQLEEAQTDDGQAVHRLLGHPDPIQAEMEGQC